MFFRPSLFDVIADYVRWRWMVSGLTPSKWIVLCLGHQIPCHTRENVFGGSPYSVFHTKNFLEKIFEKWRDERDEHCFHYENLVTLRHVRHT